MWKAFELQAATAIFGNYGLTRTTLSRENVGQGITESRRETPAESMRAVLRFRDCLEVTFRHVDTGRKES